jgi:hypothetical protein
MGLRGPKAKDPETLRARGSFRSHPGRDPTRPSPVREVTRQRHVMVAERRLAKLAAELGRSAMRLVALTLDEASLFEFERQVGEGEMVFGALVDFDSPHFYQRVQLVMGAPGTSWNESEKLADVSNCTVRGKDRE